MYTHTHNMATDNLPPFPPSFPRKIILLRVITDHEPFHNVTGTGGGGPRALLTALGVQPQRPLINGQFCLRLAIHWKSLLGATLTVDCCSSALTGASHNSDQHGTDRMGQTGMISKR